MQGCVVEPMGSSWRNPKDGTIMGRRLTKLPFAPTEVRRAGSRYSHDKNNEDSYREFALEFQDLQLAYWTNYRRNQSEDATES